MREMIFDGLKKILWNVGNWFVSVVELPLKISLPLILGTLIAGVILLASGAWAAHIAENKGRRPHLHFFLALILPFIYPVLIWFLLKPLEGSPLYVVQSKKTKRELVAAQREAQIAAAEKAVADQLEREEADPTLWSRSRMERVVYNADGSAAGPFICTLSDGQMIKVRQVRDLQDEIVVLELAGDTPDTAGPVLRFPYTRIHGMEIDNQA